MFLQQLITGLSVGSIYALMAVGYSLIYSLLNFTNFAHGASVLIGAYVGYPTMFTMAKSNELTMTVILGGTGSLTGTILAGLVLIPLPEYLRIESAEEWRMVLYGVLVVAVIVFKPSGLMGSKEFTVAGVLRRCKQLAARVRKRGSKRDKEGEAKK